MKVVLFCGGFGMRMRDHGSDPVPKPMQMVGPRPLLWHVMRYYAHFGHTEFILCLGYGAEHIKRFFLDYDESLSNDFVLQDGEVELATSDIGRWRISFVNTGLRSPIGERLRRVRAHLGDDDTFLANYADVLCDAPLDDLIARFRESGAAASMLVVPPQSSFHCVELDGAGRVDRIVPVSRLPLWENGGYFILTPEVFDHLPAQGDLVEDGLGTLAAQGRLLAQPYRGFWKPADTFKERAELDQAWADGSRPWMVWEAPQPVGGRAPGGAGPA